MSAARSEFVTKLVVQGVEMVFHKTLNPVRAEAVIRKLAHFSEFALLSVSLCLCFTLFQIRFRHFAIYVMFFGLLTAVTDEFLQKFTPGRGSSVSDVLIDFSGVLCGMIFFICMAALIKFITAKPQNKRVR